MTEATAGSTVHWTDVIWNTGNDTETYQLTLSKENFPAGTTFMLFQADGATPLVQGLTPPIPASAPPESARRRWSRMPRPTLAATPSSCRRSCP